MIHFYFVHIFKSIFFGNLNVLKIYIWSGVTLYSILESFAYFCSGLLGSPLQKEPFTRGDSHIKVTPGGDRRILRKKKPEFCFCPNNFLPLRGTNSKTLH